MRYLKSVPSTAREEPTRFRHCLTFLLGADMFAFEISQIREIIEFEGITSVPLMPDFLRGIINLRGSVVPVLDLSVRFGREPTQLTKSTCVAILSLDHQSGKLDIGVLVDAVSEVIEIPENDIDEAPSLGARIRTDFIGGVATVAGRFAIILNIERVLSLEELSQLAESDFARLSAHEGPASLAEMT